MSKTFHEPLFSGLRFVALNPFTSFMHEGPTHGRTVGERNLSHSILRAEVCRCLNTPQLITEFQRTPQATKAMSMR